MEEDRLEDEDRGTRNKEKKEVDVFVTITNNGTY